MDELKRDLAALQKTSDSFAKRISYITELKNSHFDSKSSLLSLIRNDKETYLLRSTPVVLKLKNPIFVTKLELGSLYNTFEGINVKCKTLPLGETKSKSSSLLKGVDNHIVINEYISELTLYSKKEVTLTSLKIFGLNESYPSNYNITLKNIVNSFFISNKRLKKIIDKISNKTEELESRTQEIADDRLDFDTYKSSLEKEVNALEDKEKQLSESVKLLEDSYTDANEKLTDTNAQLKILRNEEDNSVERHNQLKLDIAKYQGECSELRNHIKELENNKNIFSEDLAGYVKETRFQQLFYGVICFTCIVIAIVLSCLIFERAFGIISLFNTNNTISVLDLILSRLPFTLAIIAVFTFLTTGIHLTLNRLIKIHEQRLVFLRLSILSRDITSSSSANLDMTDEEKINERIKLKLLFLRSHLDKDVNTDDIIEGLKSN